MPLRSKNDPPPMRKREFQAWQRLQLEKRGEATMLDRLKTLNIDAMSLEEAIELSAFARSLQSEFAQQQVTVPEWLDSRMKELSREIKTRNADALEKRLRELKGKREGLEDANTRRQRIDEEIAILEAKLS